MTKADMDKMNWRDEVCKRMIEDYESMVRVGIPRDDAYMETVRSSVAGTGAVRDFTEFVYPRGQRDSVL